MTCGEDKVISFPLQFRVYSILFYTYIILFRKGTIKWAEYKKKKQISFWILEREYLGPSGQRYELASEVQINLCFSEREYLPLTQIVIKVWLGFTFLIILDFLRFWMKREGSWWLKTSQNAVL